MAAAWIRVTEWAGADGQPLARGRARLAKCDQNPLLPYTPSASCPLPISCKTTAFIQKPTNVGREAGGPEQYRACLWAWSMPRLLSQGFLGTVLQRGCQPCPKVRGEGWPMALTPLSADAEYCIISIFFQVLEL